MNGSKATPQIGDNSFKSRVIHSSTNGLFHSHYIPFTPFTLYIKKTKNSFSLHGVTNLLCYEVKTDGRKHFYKHDYILKKSFIFIAYLL